MGSVDEALPAGVGAHTTTPVTPVTPTRTATTAAVTVNGRTVSLEGTTAHTSALDWLREQGLTGAKEGCAEGECGACAVLVLRPVLDLVRADEFLPANDPTANDPTAPGRSQWTAVTSCLVPAASLDGQEILTSEGLGTPDALHPVQRVLALGGASQCGYCTPGFVCSMAAEYYRGSTDGFDLEALAGNLCRCTGYRAIRDAAFALGEPSEQDVWAARRDRPAPALRRTRTGSRGGAYARATSVAEALELLEAHEDAVVVAGGTDWGVEVNLRAARPSLVIGIDRVPELRTLRVGAEMIELGAGLTFSEIEAALAGRVPLLADLVPQFASRLIRNSATLGGNLATASPVGDAAPVLLALEATVVLISRECEREQPLTEFFTGYRQTAKRPGELIRAVRIPVPLSTVTAFHKIAKRRFDDISSVAVAAAVEVADGVVTKARIGLGGVAATCIRARSTEAALEGQPWERDTVAAAATVLRGEGTPLDDHRASAAYRVAMLGTSLLRLQADHPDPGRPAATEVAR